MTSRFRVTCFDMNASRGRGSIVAIIDDAKDVGGSEHVNDQGEMFFTLPWNHPQIGALSPLLNHYEISRLSSSGTYTPIFTGLLDDYEATADDVVFYGRDYLSLLNTTISSSNTSYTNAFVGTIIASQISAARSTTGEPHGRVNFITQGTIETTSTTTTVLTSYQPRLDFIAGLCDILMSDRSVHSIIRVTPRTSYPPSFTFTENLGSDKEDVRLEYGGLMNDFRYRPGYGNLRTRINAIGQKREGASVLFSAQTYASESTYGWISEATVFVDIVDQTALDNKTKRMARRRGRVGTGVAIAIRANQIGPWEGYDLGDAIRVVIDRGLTQVNGLYSVWGLEWIGHKNGSEDLFLSLVPKDV